MMALTPQRIWVRMQSTHPSGKVEPLMPTAPERPLMALCSPVGGKGRLVPTTLYGLESGEMVEAPRGCLRKVGRQRHLVVEGRA
jgi:hypothetical protein